MTKDEQYYVQIPVPVPIPLKFVNVYLLKAEDGWRIIDTGLNTREGKETWNRAFSELGIQPEKDIVEIILTHYHPDHLGLAGWLHELTGAPVRMSEPGKKAALYIWDPAQPQAKETAEFFTRHGMPEHETRDIEQHMIDFMRFMTPLPPIKEIRNGEKLTLTVGEEHLPILTPGHCDGHFAFLGEKSGLFIGGDQLLQKISPNVSLWPNMDPNPLQSYITSLKELKELPIRKVFPGHGRIFTEAKERIDELLHHHDERLEEVLGYLKEGEQTAYEICRKLFSHRELDLHQLRFAMSEALAHLVYLEKENQIRREDDGTLVKFFI
ncbi:MAG: MBL fold metallo-hydrolase [Bacillaceae bacterium]|nr:MBL fold metallo-hydrolase [Bacillaceae bacterium]